MKDHEREIWHSVFGAQFAMTEDVLVSVRKANKAVVSIRRTRAERLRCSGCGMFILTPLPTERRMPCEYCDKTTLWYPKGVDND